MSCFFKAIFKSISVLCTACVLASCSSQPIVPSADNIKIKREDPDKACENLGAIEGRNNDLKGNIEKAIEDLKKEAAYKGANYVRMEVTSGLGNSVRGTAFKCP